MGGAVRSGVPAGVQSARRPGLGGCLFLELSSLAEDGVHMLPIPYASRIEPRSHFGIHTRLHVGPRVKIKRPEYNGGR